MKLLHASDLLLGKGFEHVHPLAQALRDARMEALRSLLALAAREKVEAIVLAGNTLADSRVSHQVVVQMTSLLATSTVPVYLLPGQTDPLRADSPYVMRPDLFVPPIHLLQQPLLPRNGPPVAVGCGPTPPAVKAEYMAMGGSPLPRSTPPAHWSGTPESFDYGQGVGQVNLVTFPGPVVRPLTTGRLRWLEKEATSLVGLSTELGQLASDSTLLRLRLTGTATLEQLQEFEEWRRKPRFQWLEVDNQMRIAGGKRYHHPLLRSLQERLEIPGADPEINRQAVLSLHALVSQSGKEDLI